MNRIALTTDTVSLFLSSLRFIRANLFTILGLGLIASFGRVIQLGGFGPISPAMNIVLEVIVESSRLILVLFAVGQTNIVAATKSFLRLFKRGQASAHLRQSIKTFRANWGVLLINLVAFSVVAYLLNLLIDQLAYETCLLLTLKSNGILADKSSEWTILLFFKNLSVIPLTLVFETMILMWLVQRSRIAGQVKA